MMVGVGPVLLWLHARWRPRRSGFVPYVLVALQNEIFKYPQSWPRIF